MLGIASAAGFLLGSERMANVFSFFWGTHEFWSRFRNKVETWSESHFNERWLLIIVLIVLAGVVWIQFL